MKRTVTLFLLLPLCLAAEEPPAAQTVDLKRIEAVADFMAHAHIAAGVIPGMTVAVAKDGVTLFAKGYGKADVEMNVAAGPETVYKIRSITKQFTAAIIMRLVEAGKISLDDPITKYLPDYPTQGHHVTVRHLLNHTSGITTESSRLDRETALSGGNRQWFKLDLSYEEMVDRFGKLPFEFKPGEQYDYNNFGYYLLGEIIGKVTGTPYPEYVERELLRPLGLDRTLYCDDIRIIPSRAEGYEHFDGKLVNAPYTSPRAGGAAGALCSTVRDLVRWTHLLFGGKVVSATALRQMTSPTELPTGTTSRYGYGLYLDDVAGHRKFFHGGTRPGFGTFLAHYPEDRLTIVILMNSGTARSKAEEFEKDLARAALGIEVRDFPLTAQDIARYEGEYTFQDSERTLALRVFGEEGQLKAQLGKRVTRLRSQGGDVFIGTIDDDFRVAFKVENGRAESATLQQARIVVRGQRKRSPS